MRGEADVLEGPTLALLLGHLSRVETKGTTATGGWAFLWAHRGPTEDANGPSKVAREVAAGSQPTSGESVQHPARGPGICEIATAESHRPLETVLRHARDPGPSSGRALGRSRRREWRDRGRWLRGDVGA